MRIIPVSSLVLNLGILIRSKNVWACKQRFSPELIHASNRSKKIVLWINQDVDPLQMVSNSKEISLKINEL